MRTDQQARWRPSGGRPIKLITSSTVRRKRFEPARKGGTK
jgi:hypothetical protein